LSEITPKGGSTAFSLSPEPKDDQDVNLGDISERDKVWDKHRANVDKVSEHYKGSQYKRYSDRLTFCSELLDFKLTPDADEGVLKLKLANARFCRVRHCPVCQWRRSLMWKAKAHKILPHVVEHYPKHRWLFLTLTVRNCAITELRETLDWMHKAFVRLTKLKQFPGVGWIKSTEVTRGKNPVGSAHPHFHILLMVPASYFSGQDYLSQSRWAELWQKATRLDYQPMTHVKAVAKHHDPQVLIPEILKYQVKKSDLVADRGWFLELTKQLHKTRAVSVGGVLRDYMRALEEEPEDLIGEGDESAPDEGHLYFGWKKPTKKYKLVNDK
jgi:plasmid rolling circle replication initiator protein Rep